LTPLSHHALVAQQHYQSFHNITHGNSRRPNRPKQGTASQNFGGSSISILGQYPTHPSPPLAGFPNKTFSNSLHGKHRFNTRYNHSQFGRSRYRGHCQICKQEGHSASNCNYRYIHPDSNNSDNISTQFAGFMSLIRQHQQRLLLIVSHLFGLEIQVPQITWLLILI